tara:strand:- start:357 stop:842 length:486 start_codon:yes stop_codon:yes gene_type:complete
MKQKRNDNCSCGSGKKYKACHGKTESSSNNTVYLVTGAVIVFFIFLFFGETDSSVETIPVSHSPILPYANTSSSKPPGEAPPGKVWSQEHGHWHDAPNQVTGPVDNRPQRTLPPPQFDKDNPPPGKVWSEEHGHFHDDPRKKSNPIKITPNQISSPEKKTD